jgi:hypothetical protein
VDFALIIGGYQVVPIDYQAILYDCQVDLYDYQALEVIMALYSNFIGLPFVERFYLTRTWSKRHIACLIKISRLKRYISNRVLRAFANVLD